MQPQNGTELCSTTASDGIFTIQIPQGTNISSDNWVGLYVQNRNSLKVADVPITQVGLIILQMFYQ